jgi:hypothetical protein
LDPWLIEVGGELAVSISREAWGHRLKKKAAAEDQGNVEVSEGRI